MVDLQTLCRRLERHSSDIDDLDVKILASMLDENCTTEDYQSEVNQIDEYRDKVNRAKTRIEMCLSRPRSECSVAEYASVFSSASGESKKKTFKLPKKLKYRSLMAI